MRRTRFFGFPCVVVVVIAILLACVGTAQAAPATGCGAWSIIPNPNPGVEYDFSGVSAISAKDVWAVGTYYNTGGRRALGLIEHWNGTAWAVKKSFEPGSRFNGLSAVVAITGKDAWAVGDYRGYSKPFQTLAEHWNGTSWSLVNSPNPGSLSNVFYSISADASNDVWAVGFYTNTKSAEQTLVEHWNGSSWSIVPSLNVGLAYSVTAISPTDVWVVGNDQMQSLIEHWNGSSWTIVPSAAPGTSNYSFDAIAAVSANDIWVAGSYTKGIHSKTLIEHWNSKKWSIVSSPSSGSFLNGLGSMAVISANDIWR